MAYSWKILKAAVEQEILFPSESCFGRYVHDLTVKGEYFEVTSVNHNEDGTITAVFRKRYNNNAFLASK